MSYGILFTGQGSQFSEMARELIEKYPLAADIFKIADSILGYSITDICTKEELFKEMEKTNIAQPAIFVLEYALYSVMMEFLKDKDYMPSFMAGHSLGEYTALAAGGVMSFKDTLKLVSKRGTFMSESAEKNKSTMIAVTNISKEIFFYIEEYIKKNNNIFLACENSERQKVYSLKEDAKEDFINFVEEHKGKAKVLSVEGGFHSPYMKSAAEKLNSELRKCSFLEPKCNIYSNTLGRIYKSSEEIKEVLPKHIIECVKWETIIKKIEKSSTNLIIEIGPRPILLKEIKKDISNIEILHLGANTNIVHVTKKVKDEIQNDYKDNIKKMLRNIVCSKSDGKVETLKKREEAYELFMNMIYKDNITADKLAIANNIYNELF